MTERPTRLRDRSGDRLTSPLPTRGPALGSRVKYRAGRAATRRSLDSRGTVVGFIFRSDLAVVQWDHRPTIAAYIPYAWLVEV